MIDVFESRVNIDVDSPERTNPWIQTVSGGVFHILNPQQSEILIEDIGHALSMMCRWTGHVRQFYSVAEHSVHASYLTPLSDALWALLHDSSEAYIADLSRPIKHFTGAGLEYRKVETKIMEAVCIRFNLSREQPESVHVADDALLYAEKYQLMPPVEWDTKWGNGSSANIKIKCWPQEVAKTVFLHRFYELTEQI